MERFYFLIMLVLFASCANLSRFQSGKTIGKNKTQIGGNIVGYGIVSGDIEETIVLPFMNFHGSYGLKEKLDIGIVLSTGGNAQAFTKIQILGSQTSKSALSVEPGIAFQYAGDEDGPGLRYHLGIPYSHQMNNKINLLVEPKYVLQHIHSDISHFVGLNGGLEYAVNDKFNLTLGGSWFSVGGNGIVFADNTLFNGGIGMSYIFSVGKK